MEGFGHRGLPGLHGPDVEHLPGVVPVIEDVGAAGFGVAGLGLVGVGIAGLVPVGLGFVRFGVAGMASWELLSWAGPRPR